MNCYRVIITQKDTHQFIIDDETKDTPIVFIPNDLEYYHCIEEMVDMFLDSVFKSHSIVHRKFIDNTVFISVENVSGLTPSFRWVDEAGCF